MDKAKTKEMRRTVHNHYIYELKFNSINVTITLTDCDVVKQKDLIETQEGNDYWKEFPDAYFVAYAEEDHCTLIKTVPISDLKQAAKSSTQIKISETTTMFLDTTNQDPIISKKELESLFQLDVLRRDAVMVLFQELRRDVTIYMIGNSANQGPAAGSIDNRELQVLKKFDDAERLLNTSTETVDNEPQFNTWFFANLEKRLQPLGFSVEPNKVNKKIKPNVSEYSSSKADCFIWHPNGCAINDTVKGLEVFIDEFCDDKIDLHEVNGEVIEVKLNEVDKAAISERFCNMFGCASKLITLLLSEGKLIYRGIMYGIVCGMRRPDHCMWLQLELDFSNRRCHFQKLAKLLPFGTILDAVLKKISEKTDH